MGIEESKEMIEFVDGLIDDIAEAKEDDGELSKFEMVQLAIENLPAGVQAFAGADDIADELSELDPVEQAELIQLSLPVMQKLARLFIKE